MNEKLKRILEMVVELSTPTNEKGMLLPVADFSMVGVTKGMVCHVYLYGENTKLEDCGRTFSAMTSIYSSKDEVERFYDDCLNALTEAIEMKEKTTEEYIQENITAIRNEYEIKMKELSDKYMDMLKPFGVTNEC